MVQGPGRRARYDFPVLCPRPLTSSLCSPLEGGVVLRDGLESVASNYFFIEFRATAAIGHQRALTPRSPLSPPAAAAMLTS